MTRYLYSKLAVIGVIFLPAVTFAQNGPDLSYLENAVIAIGELVLQLIPIVIALGLLFFIWGLVQFILASGDEEAKDAGKRRMVWGVIALFVIISVWGLVGILSDLTGIEFVESPLTPTVDFLP